VRDAAWRKRLIGARPGAFEGTMPGSSAPQGTGAERSATNSRQTKADAFSMMTHEQSIPWFDSDNSVA
jgi:hypothetical protein